MSRILSHILEIVAQGKYPKQAQPRWQGGWSSRGHCQAEEAGQAPGQRPHPSFNHPQGRFMFFSAASTTWYGFVRGRVVHLLVKLKLLAQYQ